MRPRYAPRPKATWLDWLAVIVTILGAVVVILTSPACRARCRRPADAPPTQPSLKMFFPAALAAFIVSFLYLAVTRASMDCFGPNVHDRREQQRWRRRPRRSRSQAAPPPRHSVSDGWRRSRSSSSDSPWRGGMPFGFLSVSSVALTPCISVVTQPV
jgi:hypothetical protein